MELARPVEGVWLQYPRVSDTDVDTVICTKSEEAVRSDAEGGAHRDAACALRERSKDGTPGAIVVCRPSPLRGCSLPFRLVPPAH